MAHDGKCSAQKTGTATPSNRARDVLTTTLSHSNANALSAQCSAVSWGRGGERVRDSESGGG